jgi:hypothetical protein
MVNEHFRTWSLLIVFATSGAAVAITEFSGVSGKWEDVIVFTVLLFTGLILLCRTRWRTWEFWRNLVLTFALHAVAVGVIFQTVSIGPRGIPGLVMTAITMVEGVLIIVVWDRLASHPTASRKFGDRRD